jgi:hypothetical protein
MFQQQVIAGNTFGDALETKFQQMKNASTHYSIRYPDTVLYKANVGVDTSNSAR